MDPFCSLIHSSSRNKTIKENMEITKHKLNEENKKMRNQWRGKKFYLLLQLPSERKKYKWGGDWIEFGGSLAFLRWESSEEGHHCPTKKKKRKKEKKKQTPKRKSQPKERASERGRKFPGKRFFVVGVWDFEHHTKTTQSTREERDRKRVIFYVKNMEWSLTLRVSTLALALDSGFQKVAACRLL